MPLLFRSIIFELDASKKAEISQFFQHAVKMSLRVSCAMKQEKLKHFDLFLFRLFLYNNFFLVQHKNVVINLQNEQTENSKQLTANA